MEAPRPYRESRPWGEFVRFSQNTPSTVKIITVNAGEAFSLQTHRDRDEFWHIISGNGQITLDSLTEEIVVEKDYFVPRGTAHRIEATSSPVVFLEIAFGTFDENDIVRIEDRYGRTPPN